MKALNFEKQNIIIAEHQKEYLPLPACVTSDGIVTVCYGLSLIERIKILFLGKFFFTVLTFGQLLQPQLPTLEFPADYHE